MFCANQDNLQSFLFSLVIFLIQIDINYYDQ